MNACAALQKHSEPVPRQLQMQTERRMMGNIPAVRLFLTGDTHVSMTDSERFVKKSAPHE